LGWAAQHRILQSDPSNDDEWDDPLQGAGFEHELAREMVGELLATEEEPEGSLDEALPHDLAQDDLPAYDELGPGELDSDPGEHPWHDADPLTQGAFDQAMDEVSGDASLDDGLGSGFDDSREQPQYDAEPGYADSQEEPLDGLCGAAPYSDAADDDPLSALSEDPTGDPWQDAESMTQGMFDEGMDEFMEPAMADDFGAGHSGSTLDDAVDDPWQTADATEHGMLDDAMQHSGGLPMEPGAMVEGMELGMGQTHQGQEVGQGLEAMVQDEMPQPMQEPGPQQEVDDEQMMGPWQMPFGPGFGPGPGPAPGPGYGPGPGFGPMGPMPGP
jgi:hypothetical protein